MLNKRKFFSMVLPAMVAWCTLLLVASDSAAADVGIVQKEQVLGLENLEEASNFNERALVLFRQGRYAEAEPLYKRALAIREKQLGPDHPNVAASLNNLAMLYRHQGRYAEAEPLYKRTLSIVEKQLDPEHPNVAASLNNLAELYRYQDRVAEAEPLYKRSLSILEKQLGPGHPSVAISLNNLALLYQRQGRYAEAEPLYQRSLDIQEKQFGAKHPLVAIGLNNLAELNQQKGRYAEAEPLYKRSLAILEKQLGPEHPSVAIGLNNLATLFREQGRYAEAEPLYKRSLSILEKHLGPEHPDVATSVNNLAGLYQQEGRYAEVEPLYKRSLIIKEKQLGAEHPDIATSLNDLASLYRHQGRHIEAEPLYKRSLAILEKQLGAEHPLVAASLSNLAGLYQDQGRHAEAEPMYKRSLAIREKQLGPEHPSVAISLNNLATLFREQGRHAEAEPLYKRALDHWEKQLGAQHPSVGTSLNNLAALYQDQGRYAEALSYSRRAFQIFRTRNITTSSDSAAGQTEKTSRKHAFIFHLGLVAKLSQSSHVEHQELAAEAFEASQLARTSGTGDAVSRMATRFAAGTDALARKVRQRQDQNARLQKLDADLIKTFSHMPDKRNAAQEQQLRDDMATLIRELAALDQDLTDNFSEYAELTSTRPVNIAELQKLLHPNEALLAYTVAANEGYLFVLRSDKAEVITLKVSSAALDQNVTKLRQQLDPFQNPKLLPFDVQTSYALSQSIFKPAVPFLAGAQHIMLVLDSPLQSLPFGVLVNEAPKDKITQLGDHRQVPWLNKQYAFTTLPSVSALRALRTHARREPGKRPFVGFGDPVLREVVDITKPVRRASVMTARGLADVDELRQLPRLPDTAKELSAIAKILNASEKDLRLQERATETAVKGMDVSVFRTIAFATHGMMAGEITRLNEPGLVLTPPQVGTALDDGYLSAGEIAQLKLNADWVLLSACNTAAPDGTPGAEGLSGLAKAFFYAGARSLLVSHWYVNSEATMALEISLMREYARHPDAGKAEALRQASWGVMSDVKHQEYAHPMFWAPFVVVGEGGGHQGPRTGRAPLPISGSLPFPLSPNQESAPATRP